jgi:hypothetical protein
MTNELEPNLTRSKRSFVVYTLIALLGAGFSYYSPVFSQESRKTIKNSETTKKSSLRNKSEKSDKEENAGIDQELFLQEEESNVKFLPDIFRCPECGYEQDEAGYCPDHNEIELVKILAKGRDPLEPTELDGNEDIIVDIPLKNLEFRKDAVLNTASPSETLEKK